MTAETARSMAIAPACSDDIPDVRADLAPISDADRERLIREWSEANLRGDLDARSRIEAEILGHDVPQAGSGGTGSRGPSANESPSSQRVATGTDGDGTPLNRSVPR